MRNEIQKLFDELVIEIQNRDNEGIHGKYDDIVKLIAKKYEPEIMQELDSLVKGFDFWYA